MKNEFRENEKKLAAKRAAEYIKDGMVLGLGSGSTSCYLILYAGELVRSGMRLQAVASSEETARIAGEQGIEILDIDEVGRIDLAIDGVDEIDPAFNAIKGGGGALFREKLIADMAAEVIWVMDSTKEVAALGAFPLPLEILPYGHTHILAKLDQAGLHPRLRMKLGDVFLTDNGHYIADLQLSAPLDLATIRSRLQSIVGVLEDGLFLNMCNRMIVARGDETHVLENPRREKKN